VIDYGSRKKEKPSYDKNHRLNLRPMIEDACTRQEIEATTRDVCQLFSDGGAQFGGRLQRPEVIMLLDIVLA
jgi:hypothetical protein